MPTEGDLVPSIIDLLEFNAAEVSDSRWDYDVDKLLRAINETVERRASSRRRQPQRTRPRKPRARPDAEEQARREAEEQARREAEEQARREAEEQARRDAEEQARRDAEEQARREAEEQARREAEEQARREAEEQARVEAEEQARRQAEERARRDAKKRARRDEDEAERQVHPRPIVGHGSTPATESSPLEAGQQIRTRSSGAPRKLLRRRAVIIPTTVGIAGVMVLVAYLMSARRGVEATIMGHLPNASHIRCTATSDKSAYCDLADGNVVFFRLFDTPEEAKASVTSGGPRPSDSGPCPPSAPSVDSPVIVCRYAVGPDNEKGLATFSYIAKDTRRYYLSRWVPDADQQLRSEMSTSNASPLDWTTLTTNWSSLASKP